MSAKRDAWFRRKVTMITTQGYRAIPVYKDGGTPGYAKGQSYDADNSKWEKAVHIGVALDDAVLLDYDGNKTDDIIGLNDLADRLELDRDELDAAMVQHNTDGDSIHFLFDRGQTLDGLKQSNDGKWCDHIDIKTGNQLMHVKPGKVIVGDTLPDASWELCECPAVLIGALESKRVVVVEPVDDEDADLLSALDSTPVEEIREKLASVDPDCGYEDWRNVGMALHDWNRVDGLALWDEWSKGSDKYDTGACAIKWESFSKGGGVGIGTLYHMAQGVKVAESVEALTTIKEAIKDADAAFIKTDISRMIRAAQLDTIDQSVVLQAVQGRLKELEGQTVPIGTLRKMFAAKRNRPEWCDDWVYVNSHLSFFSLDDRGFYKKEAFDLKCGHQVPADENGTKTSAYRFVSESSHLEVVAATVYWPGVSDIVCTLPMTGDRMVNTFDHRSVPVASDVVTDDGAAAIAVIKRHLEVLVGNKADADLLMQWLAHNVQNPGVKMLWSPLIQSIQGVGKSFLGRLLMAALGDSNVGIVSPKQAISDNNGWATNVCVNVLEELKIAGHNRHEAANALKPLITDPYIQITDKYVKAYKTMNTTNYICFTNHKDAIPLEDNDRRWWVVFCSLDNLFDIGKPFGLSLDQYLDELWGSLDDHPGCIRRWLLDLEISDQFKAMKQAPMTIHKEAMIATEKGGVEWMDEIAELIEKGGQYFGSQAVSSPDLFAALDFEEGIPPINNIQKNLILKKLGFMQHPGKVKIDGISKTVWTKRSMNNQEIREIFAKVPF